MTITTPTLRIGASVGRNRRTAALELGPKLGILTAIFTKKHGRRTVVVRVYDEVASELPPPANTRPKRTSYPQQSQAERGAQQGKAPMSDKYDNSQESWQADAKQDSATAWRWALLMLAAFIGAGLVVIIGLLALVDALGL